jgi:hypothetical protein
MTTTRSHCAITGTGDLEHLYSFEKFPVFMGCADGAQTDDLFAPMNWWISKSSGAIQLKELLPLEVIYPESHGAGEVGRLWRMHHTEFARFISQIKPKAVFEIGGAHGILEAEHRRYRDIPWTILEPNPHPVPETQATFIKGFFDETFRFDGEFDTVVHSHLFEHIYDPVVFMENLKGFIPEGSSLVFSLPNMMEMLRRKYTNCLNFEHTLLLTEPYLEFLLTNHGFEIRNTQYFQEDHSVFFHAVRNSAVAPVPLPGGLYALHAELFSSFWHHHLDLVSQLNKQLKELESPTYIFGAHVFTQFLIAFGLETEGLVGILDNDVAKQGRRLYGTSMSVFPPSVLRGRGKTNIVLTAGVYNNEIRTDIIQNYNGECLFLP